MLHPDSLFDVANLQHQDRLREVEIWQLARQARQSRAQYLGRLLHHWLAATRKQLRAKARPSSATSDLANLCR